MINIIFFRRSTPVATAGKVQTNGGCRVVAFVAAGVDRRELRTTVKSRFNCQLITCFLTNSSLLW